MLPAHEGGKAASLLCIAVLLSSKSEQKCLVAEAEFRTGVVAGRMCIVPVDSAGSSTIFSGYSQQHSQLHFQQPSQQQPSSLKETLGQRHGVADICMGTVIYSVS